MANVFLDLPVPVADGVGVAVDTSSLGKTRTFTIQGDLDGASITIEISNDGGADFVPLISFAAGGKKTVKVAAQFTRVRVVGSVNGAVAANCDVGSNDDGGMFVNLPAAAGDGIGASVDVSALGTFNTAVVTGDFTGQIELQISEDGTDWTTCFTFTAPDQQSKLFVAQFMRTVRSQSNPLGPGTAEVDIGAINDAGGGGGGGAAGGASSCLVFQPGGGATGPVVFDTWAGVIAQLAVLKAAAGGTGGCYEIEIDDSVVSPAVIPAGGPYDLTDTAIIGPPDRLAVGNVADGASFTGLRTFRGNLTLVNLNTGVSPVADLVSGDTLTFDDANVECGAGAVPFFTTPLIGGGGFLFASFENGGQIGLGTAVPVIDLAVAGSIFIPVNRIGGIQRGSLSSIAGSIILVQVITRGAILGSPSSFPAVLGTISFSVSASAPPSNVFGSLSAPVVGPQSFVGNDVAYYDASGALITQVLPTIDAAAGFNLAGQIIRMFEVSGSAVAGLEAMAAAGDTINGLAAPYRVPIGGDIILISDGIDNWTVVDPNEGRWRVSALFAADPGIGVQMGTIIRCDPTGGGFAVTLRPISGAANPGSERGRQIIVKNSSGSVNPITVTPSAGDTIDGAATFVITTARASITLVSDGVSNWEIV